MHPDDSAGSRCFALYISYRVGEREQANRSYCLLLLFVLIYEGRVHARFHRAYEIFFVAMIGVCCSYLTAGGMLYCTTVYTNLYPVLAYDNSIATWSMRHHQIGSTTLAQ